MDQVSIADAQTLWPKGLTQVPFQVYQDPALPQQEQRLLFEGPGVEFPVPGGRHSQSRRLAHHLRRAQCRSSWSRTETGGIAAFENRCLHRGALICLDNAGNAKDFTCVYHAWRYDLSGNLKSIAFRSGVNGKGGMPDSFRPGRPRHPQAAHHHDQRPGLRHLRPTIRPDIEDFIGPEVSAALHRIASRKLQVIGRFTEVLPNNWKLYAENVRDTYHASLLHVFFATFRINRLSQGGGVSVSDTGGCARLHHARADPGNRHRL